MTEAAAVDAARKKSHPLRRLGCAALLLLWFALLMTPCCLFYLAANGEIRIWHSDIPQPHVHPRLLIALISEPQARGLRFENAAIAAGGADRTCVQTTVRYVLWETDESNLDAVYCDCYRRADETAAWELDSTVTGGCAGADAGG